MIRYSSRPFPPYRYVPGGPHPHPTRDAGGHSYRDKSEAVDSFSPQAWDGCETYRYGIDLLNHGYWWEAHEALEAVWVAAGRRTETGQFIQGLILIAVALLKRHQGLHDIAERMAVDGINRLPVRHRSYCGVDTTTLRADAEALFGGRQSEPLQVKLDMPSDTR